MSKLKHCPFCAGEMKVRMYDEEFYRAVLGTDYECNPEFEVEHVDRLAAAMAKCPLEMVCYKSEADAITVWNTRAEQVRPKTNDLEKLARDMYKAIAMMIVIPGYADAHRSELEALDDRAHSLGVVVE